MFQFDVNMERDLSKAKISKEDMKKKEDIINSYNLVKNIKIKSGDKITIINTFGKIKKHINSIKDIEKLEKYLEKKKLSKSEYVEYLIKKDKNIEL